MPTSLADLPRELLLHIFSFLDPDTLLASVALVSRRLSAVSRDSLLWQPLCARAYPAIAFPPHSVQRSRNYWREYLYQQHADALARAWLAAVSNTPAARERLVVAVARLGLRARPALAAVLAADTSSLREKYYARELIAAINQRHAVIRVLHMFARDNDNTQPFDPFEFLLAFDSFYLERPPAWGPAVETTYPDIAAIKAQLRPAQQYIEKCAALTAAPLREEEAVAAREKLHFYIQSLGYVLYDYHLLNDISVARVNQNSIPGLFLHGILNSRHRPSSSLIGAIIYRHFACWAGLDASIVVLDYDSFVRIETPAFLKGVGDNEPCFFIDVNRRGKMRTADEMRAIISLGRGVYTSLQPSSSKSIVDVFLQHFTDGYPIHQDPSRTSAVMLLGAMLFSFMLVVSQKYNGRIPRSVAVPPPETNNSRTAAAAQAPLRDPSETPPLPGASSGADEKLTHLYTMAISTIIYKMPCALNLAYDFLFPLAPSGTITATDKTNAARKVGQQLHFKTLPFTEQDYEFRKKFGARPKYHLGQVHYTDRSGICGVIVGWSYVSQIAGRNYYGHARTRSSSTSPPVSPGLRRGGTTTTPSTDDATTSLVQYIVLLDSSANVLKVLEPAVCIASFSQAALLRLRPNLFGIEVGKYFDYYDERRHMFVPGAELLSHFCEEREFFAKR